MQSTGRKLSFLTMVAYGVGQVGERLRLAGFGIFLLFYYQQVVGLSGKLTSAAIALAGFFDAFSDPIMGALSDRTKTRWGRRHPFMLLGMVPLAVGFYAVFDPPRMSPTGTFLWLFGFTLLSRVGTSLYHVAHMALGAEMAHDYTQRSTLYSFNIFFEHVAFAAGPALAYLLFFPTTPRFNPGLLNAAGYRGFGLCFAVGMVLAVSLSAYGTRREIPFLPDSTQLHRFSLGQVLRDVRDVFRNQSFRALFLGLLLGALSLGVQVALTPYLGTHFWGFTTEQLALLPMMTLIGLCIAMPIVPAATRRFDKRRLLIVGAVLSVLSLHLPILFRLLDLPLMPKNGSPLLLPLYLATYLIFSILSPIVFVTATSMFADIADEHELETSERREGVIFAARAFAIAMIQSLSVVLTGILLDWIAFPKAARMGSVAPEVVAHLGWIPIAAAAVNLVGTLLYTGYRLDQKRHSEIAAELAKRRQQRAQPAQEAPAPPAVVRPAKSAAR